MDAVLEIIVSSGGRAKVTMVKNGIREVKMTTMDEIGRHFAEKISQDSGELAIGVRRVKKNPEATYVVVQQPAKIREIQAFQGHYTIPLPDLLFMFEFSHRDGLYHYARAAAVAMASATLIPTSRVYEFPLGNVTFNRICWGDSHGYTLGRNLNTGIDDLFNIFWASNFNNHLNAGKYPVTINNVVINSMEGVYPALQGLAEFPASALLPVHANLTQPHANLTQPIDTYAEWLNHFGLNA